ncbi:hypothetical protein [Actinomadura roseirufa]|uniref:hypothetical protein n=1 Tax=Actinomadura roseirufa TaxID=2094049 RepID=UPI00104198C7|nr:hypothetical protein [Actinomadura roseirufa]
MIKQWEAGKYVPRPNYRALYAKATGKSEEELFGDHPPAHGVLWRPSSPDRAVTLDDSDRLTAVSQRSARLDVTALEALASILAGQRRLEDAVGPAVLLGPVTGQLDVIAGMLREARGPLRMRLGRVAAEWSVFAGWLNAALRRDVQALALFGEGEELADEFEDGTVAAIATSFRGYVARKQGRPRAVVRASMAALATPGGHPVQRIFDELQAAQGYAALGEAERARRLLDDAAERAADDVEPPPPVYWYGPSFFQLNIGMAHRDLGGYSDAAALLSSGLGGIPADQAGAEWLGEYKDALAEARERA